MKILEERDKFLSNFEVAEHLDSIKSKYNWTFKEEENDKKKNKKRFTACGLNLEEITRDLSSYLENNSSSAITTQEGFKDLMIHLNGLELMKVEKLQIVNSLPRSMVHLYALVEECDQRFDEETCEGIINKINDLFPIEQEEEEDEEVEEGEEDKDDQFEDAEDLP
mmetsp:Transcript_189/g.219  ORF Transcript_189/g.219 Transcript_189/m.219 type:complete len:166 (-) Transcript_189:60-557(-)